MKLNIFFTAGYFTELNTLEMIQSLEESGVDRVEVGMPYSDPVVDGPVIQKANMEALENGMTIERLFHELAGLKDTVNIPVVLMGYLNPVLQFGFEKFCQKANEVGISGLIIPDLPPEIWEKQYKTMFEQYKLTMTFIVTPQTEVKRMAYLDNLGSGFIYAVADSSITGSNLDHTQRQEYFERLKHFGFKNECYVGFGIRTKEDLDYLSQYVDGGIIGTAFINYLKQGKHPIRDKIKAFISMLE
ncbi:MAG: tryptophan synthase subunit alpha [Weeksellaceae bacterium]